MFHGARSRDEQPAAATSDEADARTPPPPLPVRTQYLARHSWPVSSQRSVPDVQYRHVIKHTVGDSFPAHELHPSIIRVYAYDLIMQTTVRFVVEEGKPVDSCDASEQEVSAFLPCKRAVLCGERQCCRRTRHQTRQQRQILQSDTSLGNLLQNRP
jgi:hypothetical protein